MLTTKLSKFRASIDNAVCCSFSVSDASPSGSDVGSSKYCVTSFASVSLKNRLTWIAGGRQHWIVVDSSTVTSKTE